MLLGILFVLNVACAIPAAGWIKGSVCVVRFASSLWRGSWPGDGDGYSTSSISCPDNAKFTRYANGLSESETQWLNERDKVTKIALEDWPKGSNMEDFDVSDFLSQGKVRVGLAFSGGGYRAMLSGAGQFSALDGRTKGSDDHGHMGGLVQASTYLAGLSGGGWLVSSLIVNNWTTVDNLVSSTRIWNFTRPFFFPQEGSDGSWGSLFNNISTQVIAKQCNSGFVSVGLTDIYGRMLGYQFFDAPNGGAALKYHEVREHDAFKSHQMPFPIHVAVGRAPGTTIINTNSTCFEFNPFDLGSWDPNVYAFTDLKYLGTEVSNGKPVGSSCDTGFDSSSFIMGTSSSIFNGIFKHQLPIPYINTGTNWFQNQLAESDWDIAPYSPNPFYKMDHVDNAITNDDTLSLVDGGFDRQNLPLQPLIQPEREVDVIFAMDNSADTTDSYPDGTNWPNGTALIAPYERQFTAQGNGTIFPYVPDVDTFMYGGLVKQPTFFGCNRDNLTSLFDSSLPEEERYYPPVIIYMANTQHSFESNYSTALGLAFRDDDFRSMIGNGYNLVTQNNGTLDSEWRTCVACAIVLREQQRRGNSPTAQCQKCLDKYCWDGSYSTKETGNAARRDGHSNLI